MFRRENAVALRKWNDALSSSLSFARGARVTLFAMAAFCASICAPVDRAHADGEAGVLLELFTSQGCYSCPPADKLLGELAQRPGVIGLSLNVDYWDYLGWKDPLAKKAYTLRQYGYVNAMRERAPFTPQLVVHGVKSVVGSDRHATLRAIRAAQTDSRISLDLRRDGGALQIKVSGTEGAGAGVVFAAPYRKMVVQEIDAGENSGKRLTYHNVAMTLQRLGRFEGSAATFSAQIPSKADGVAVWVQKSTRNGPYGEVRAASKLAF